MTPTSASRVSDEQRASAKPRSLIARTVSPIGVYASQSGMRGGDAQHEVGLAREAHGNREIHDDDGQHRNDGVQIAQLRRAACVSRRPVSSSVRTSAASSSNGQAASTPTRGAVQR